MEESPFDKAVRARLAESMAPVVGSLPALDAASVARLVEEKLRLVLPVLREALPEDATPSLDQIHRAELEATRRAMREMIGFMTDPAGQSAQSAARRELDAAPAVGPPPDPMVDEIEARLAELEARLGPDAGGTPTPQ